MHGPFEKKMLLRQLYLINVFILIKESKRLVNNHIFSRSSAPDLHEKATPKSVNQMQAQRIRRKRKERKKKRKSNLENEFYYLGIRK